MRQALFIASLLLPALTARAEVVDVHWSGAGRFVHKATIAPGKSVDLCGRLPAGLKVSWDFAAGAPLDFNLHYHAGKDVVFPSKLNAVTKASDILQTRIEQDYCWMWTNKAGKPATLSVTLQRS